MALTKFDIASSALIMIGASPVASFTAPDSAEQQACALLYQSCVDHWLSLYPWRFASRTTELSKRPESPPPTEWQSTYIAPSGFKAIQKVVTGPGNIHQPSLPFDRFENEIRTNYTGTEKLWCIHTYEPPISYWPGYFVQLIEYGLAHKLSFAISGKLDLQADLAKSVELYFRLAKNADSRQQTTRKLPLRGRGSIMEARRF